MKPKAFRVNLPLKAFSKHDDPKRVVEVLEMAMKDMFRRMENFAGELPFDIPNITAEPMYDAPESPLQGKKV